METTPGEEHPRLTKMYWVKISNIKLTMWGVVVPTLSNCARAMTWEVIQHTRYKLDNLRQLPVASFISGVLNNIAIE